MHALHPGLVVNNEDEELVDEDTHCNAVEVPSFNTLPLPEESLGQPISEQTSAPETHPMTHE